MADRLNFYFRQRVNEAELDLAFELLEKADRDLAADIGIYGIVSGAEAVQHTPVADLTIDLTAPARAYDHLGERIFFGSDQRIDCSIDHTGIPTEVSTAGNERWLGVFLKFDRIESDPRTDGNSQQVYFRQDESFQVKVRQAPEGPVGSASKVPLVEDELLICDIRRTAGQTQIFQVDIDTSRRQAFVFASGDAVEIISNLWSVIQPTVGTVQAAFDSADEILAGHFNGSDHRHPAGHVDYSPHGFIGSDNVQAALDEVVDDLSSTTSGDPGSKLIGADAVPGAPYAIPAGSVDGQLATIVGNINNHVGSSDHDSRYYTKSQAESRYYNVGEKVGNADTLDGHDSSYFAQASHNHDASYYTKSQADSRYYNVGEKVGDANTLDGHDSSYFATAGHNHDGRYLRLVYSHSSTFAAGQSKSITTLADRPDLITSFYQYLINGEPQGIIYVRGNRTPDITLRLIVIEVSSTDKDYELIVQNSSSSELYISIEVYQA